eukprot:4063141-Alexandrium_andersonii.AAC.1
MCIRDRRRGTPAAGSRGVACVVDVAMHGHVAINCHGSRVPGLISGLAVLRRPAGLAPTLGTSRTSCDMPKDCSESHEDEILWFKHP